MSLRGIQPGGGPIIILSGQGNIQASKTNWVFDAITIPFRCRLTKCQITSESVAITNAITLDVHNETQNKTLVDDEPLAAITAGALATATIKTATIDDRTIIEENDVLLVRITSGASDTSVGTRVRLFVEPIYQLNTL